MNDKMMAEDLVRNRSHLVKCAVSTIALYTHSMCDRDLQAYAESTHDHIISALSQVYLPV